ncbi:ferredoxin [Capillibacterium thermochitinicola]|uniref:ferredoxin n=1 Tax=Capillibacterium thermochitinicola TaxID=2699427 RepID=UPI0038B3AEFC
MSYKGGDHLKTKVDPELCIACGLCISMCPDIYSWDDDGKAHAIEGPVPEDQESCAEEAAENCPTSAISTE